MSQFYSVMELISLKLSENTHETTSGRKQANSIIISLMLWNQKDLSADKSACCQN